VSLGDATAFGEIVVIATCKRKHQRGITRVGEKNFAEKVIIIHHPSSIIHHPSSIIHHPSSIIHHPSSIIHHPSSIIVIDITNPFDLSKV
jgi:hypothetical protein